MIFTRSLIVNACLIIWLPLCSCGCKSDGSSFKTSPKFAFTESTPVEKLHAQLVSSSFTTANSPIVETCPPPRISHGELAAEFWNLSLDEALNIALRDTHILRSLNAIVLTSPESANGEFRPGIQSTDPNFGIEAALADFDANLQSSFTYSRNDDVFNNSSTTGGALEVRDDIVGLNTSLTKTAATGTTFSLVEGIEHSNSTNQALLFPNSWTSRFEVTVRQPLLQGRGVRFNQIAGPNNQPGLRFASGVLVSRINHEISIADFEIGVREMVQEITNAYWQLELAYENFETFRLTRNQSLETWTAVKALYDNDLPGGEADREAQARAQYFEIQLKLVAALNGDSTSGTTGIFQAEANLRRLLNLPLSDSRLIRPSDEPLDVPIIYDWEMLSRACINSRVELRQQRARIQRSQLELEAARNFTLPRLDAFVTYRNNGFGDDLIGDGPRFSSAFDDALSNDHAEWDFGMTYAMPVGLRRAYAGVRNARLALYRERSLFDEQQSQILHDLGTALRQCTQTQISIEMNRGRLDAAQAAFDSRQIAFQADAVRFDELLDSQRQLLSARLDLHQSRVAHALSQENLLLQSGRLLSEHGIRLSQEEIFDQLSNALR